MSLEFVYPNYLAALLPPAIVLFWAFRYSLVDFSRSQRAVSLAVRLMMLSLIALAAAGPVLMSPTREKRVVLLLDRSRSIDAAAGEKAARFLDAAQAAAGKKPLEVVPFAASPAPPRSVAELKAETTEPESDWRGATNISAALEPALALIPPRYVPHLVVLSDGNETAGDILAAAVRRGVAVSTVPLPVSGEPEVQLAELRFPPRVRQGEPFHLDVVVRSNVDTEGTISLYRGPYNAVQERRAIRRGENLFRFKQTVDDRRRQHFSATVDARNDTTRDDNRASGIVFVGGKPRILIVESEPRTIRDFVAALREQDISAEVRPPEGVPRTLEELDDFEALILSNVPATALTMHQMDLIRTYLSALGGGLLMLGGEQSFGLGGYYKTPIEEILPVWCDFEREREKPSLALCLVIDRSGSMGGRKMELAKDAAKSAVELLTPRDFVAVVAFDHESYVVCPMQSAASAGIVNTTISTIEAAGGTNLHPALVDAHDQLRGVPAKLKHVILLTDGHSAPGDHEGIVRRMVGDRITVSTVGLGDADNALLKRIADLGKGRHYACDDPRSIPQIFAKETIAASKSALHEIPFVPVVVTPTAVLADMDMETAPPLLGFVATRPKPTGQRILATETGEPLLVWWRYGLGISAAFTSDAKGRWGAEWLAWPDYARFWAQVVRQAMRKSDRDSSSVEITRGADGAHLTWDVIDRLDRFVNDASGSVTVIRPDLSTSEIDLRATAPGRYEAEIPLEQRGDYFLRMSLARGEGNVWSQSRGLSVDYPEELRLRPTNEELLRRLAETTDGRFDPAPETLFEADPGRVVRRTTPLWPHLLTAAIVLFIFDVLLRRVDFVVARPRRIYTVAGMGGSLRPQ